MPYSLFSRTRALVFLTCGETEATSLSASPPPCPSTPHQSLGSHRLPSDSAPRLSPGLLLMYLLPLTGIYFLLSHCLFPPTTPSPKTHPRTCPPSSHLLVAVGVQMRLEFLQRTFWAATWQVGVMRQVRARGLSDSSAVRRAPLRGSLGSLAPSGGHTASHPTSWIPFFSACLSSPVPLLMASPLLLAFLTRGVLSAQTQEQAGHSIPTCPAPLG